MSLSFSSVQQASRIESYASRVDSYRHAVEAVRFQLFKFLSTEKVRGDNVLAMSPQDIRFQESDALWDLWSSAEGDMDATDIDSTGNSIINEPDHDATDSAFPVARFYQSKAKARIAVITAIFGTYELSCKPFVRQSVATDFYCFTNNPQIVANAKLGQSNGWIVDSTPYHLADLQYEREHQLTEETNSLHQNTHPFNVAKYYKTNFHRISVLDDYDIIIWIDGTVRIVDAEMARKASKVLFGSNVTMMLFELQRNGLMAIEAAASMTVSKYASTNWLGIPQPFQNVTAQYQTYLSSGYDERRWKTYLESSNQTNRNHYGMWCTNFVPFNLKHPQTRNFLSLWREHIRSFTTQDQVSFPFVAQSLGLFPYSLPQDNIFGNADINSLFVKLEHGN
jgi:hypothetical protein